MAFSTEKIDYVFKVIVISEKYKMAMQKKNLFLYLTLNKLKMNKIKDF